jgi:diaminopimelate decarboxylase
LLPRGGDFSNDRIAFGDAERRLHGAGAGFGIGRVRPKGFAAAAAGRAQHLSAALSKNVNSCFPYRGGVLHAEMVPIPHIAAALGTPFYVYSAAGFTERYQRFAAAFGDERPLVCYAVKANSNLAVLHLFAGLGAGADIVSEGELRRALAAGIPPERIVFSGVGKTAPELATAIDAGIHQINVESLPELQRLSRLAAARGSMMPVAIRVNPDVDALTHTKIATGRKEDKFGIAIDETIAAYRLAVELPGIMPVGLAVHVGSQVLDLDPYRQAFERLAKLVVELRTGGFTVDRVDLGGGIGIGYHGERAPEPADYARLVRRIFGPLGLALAVEPGRVLTAEAGLLITTVVYIKERGDKRFVIVDAAMNDLLRPALYGAWHDVLPVRRPPPDAVFGTADLAGPGCEAGDTFAVDRDLPLFAEGDLLAVAAAGAYGAVMSSTYNSRLLVSEVLVSGDKFSVIRPRQTYDALLSLDTIPEWLAGGDRAARQIKQRGAG